MTFINKATGLPLADREYRAFISGGGEKLEVMINRKRVEVAVKVAVTPPPGPIDPPPVEPPATGSITPAQFGAALANAKGGDVIQLATGVLYAMPRTVKFALPVTIKGGTFQSIDLQGAENITFDGTVFDYKFRQGDGIEAICVALSGCKGIAFKACKFDGDVASGLSAVDNGFAAGRGLLATGCNGITVQDSVFKSWYRGLVIGESDNIQVLRNEVTDIRSDGMDFVQVKNVVIEGNNIHDFRSAPNSGDHADMIQFWTTGAVSPSTDIVIRNNRLEVGQGTWSQSLFMRNEKVDQGQASFDKMAYRSVLIENNTINNAHIHGITVGETGGLVVKGNTLTAAKLNAALKYNADYLAEYAGNTGIMRPKINMTPASKNVTLSGNTMDGKAV